MRQRILYCNAGSSTKILRSYRGTLMMVARLSRGPPDSSMNLSCHTGRRDAKKLQLNNVNGNDNYLITALMSERLLSWPRWPANICYWIAKIERFASCIKQWRIRLA
ncbi:hypothetical protein FVEG_15069 [Fusarium verticillioides 7600]|uniref:Uncharacterized protein n=1 Tax=Gibberella moniliformis (strain M3125 / FGSC 7600) TaxID=334819 RepID=W7M4F8_GIBM7|nr:hypothetical protein FVEG_15069 [Fusarium verticillioides 7600]EWG39807.1 hypothetical protein FVEG_15069 [Fusarium verticillioides 7600]